MNMYLNNDNLLTGRRLLQHGLLDELHPPYLWQLLHIQRKWNLGRGGITIDWFHMIFIQKVQQVTVTGSANGLIIEMFLDQVISQPKNRSDLLDVEWNLNSILVLIPEQLHAQQALQESWSKDNCPWPLVREAFHKEKSLSYMNIFRALILSIREAIVWKKDTLWRKQSQSEGFHKTLFLPGVNSNTFTCLTM